MTVHLKYNTTTLNTNLTSHKHVSMKKTILNSVFLSYLIFLEKFLVAIAEKKEEIQPYF